MSVPTEVPVSDRAIGPDEVTPAPVEVTIPVDQVVNPNEAIVASGTLTPIVPTVVPTVRTLKVVDHVISYSKNPNVPEVGDLRITFYKIDPKELSVIGKQNSGKIERYTTKNGTEIGLVSPGIVSSDVLFQSALDSNILLTWGLRLLGLILIFFGIMLFLSILPILGVFLPILSGIIEIGTTLISLVGTIMI